MLDVNVEFSALSVMTCKECSKYFRVYYQTYLTHCNENSVHHLLEILWWNKYVIKRVCTVRRGRYWLCLHKRYKSMQEVITLMLWTPAIIYNSMPIVIILIYLTLIVLLQNIVNSFFLCDSVFFKKINLYLYYNISIVICVFECLIVHWYQ